MTQPALMDRTDRDILDRFAGGSRDRTIARELELELAAVTDTIRTMAGSDRSAAARIVAQYDLRFPPTPDPTPATSEPAERDAAEPDTSAENPGTEDTGDVIASFVTDDTMNQALLTLYAEQRALAAPRDELAACSTSDDLLTAAEAATDAPELADAARSLRIAIGNLRNTYRTERQRRELRVLIAQHRTNLNTCLAELTALDEPAGAEQTA